MAATKPLNRELKMTDTETHSSNALEVRDSMQISGGHLETLEATTSDNLSIREPKKAKDRELPANLLMSATENFIKREFMQTDMSRDSREDFTG